MTLAARASASVTNSKGFGKRDEHNEEDLDAVEDDKAGGGKEGAGRGKRQVHLEGKGLDVDDDGNSGLGTGGKGLDKHEDVDLHEKVMDHAAGLDKREDEQEQFWMRYRCKSLDIKQGRVSEDGDRQENEDCKPAWLERLEQSHRKIWS